jgi:transposase
MANSEFRNIVVSDRRAARYLLNHCRAIDASRSLACIDEETHPIDRGKRRRRENRLPPFAGRWINNVKIPMREWLRIVELFTIDMPPASIAAEVGVSYETVLKALDTIQSAIASLPEIRAAGETDAKEDSAVYGIRPSGDGRTSLEEIAQDWILMKLDFHHAQLIFARKEMEYQSLWWSRNVLEIADSGKLALLYRIFSSDREYWSYAKERLLKYHGVSFDRLPLYLDEIKEIDFKWTHRGELLFDAVVGRLCDYAPGCVPA